MNIGAIRSDPWDAMRDALAGNRGEAAVERGGSGDSVAISSQGMEMARAMRREAEAASGDAVAKGEQAGESGGGGTLPLEAYSIPGWYVDLFGGYTTLPTEIGISALDAQTGYEKLGKADQRLFDRYSDILQTCYREELGRIGVSGDPEKYYHEFLLDNENQASVREAIYGRLESDPEAAGLMRHFGITI